MIQIGITGQSGFIGTHLYASLNRGKAFCCIPFKDEYFQSNVSLDFFTAKCDVIVHLAAIHRDPNPKKIYDDNLALTTQLLKSCNRTGRCRQIIFTSSIQEGNGSAYGKVKKDCRLKIADWAEENGKAATTLVLPNVFGPGAKPFHTSFIATFSHQLWHGEEPRIIEDKEVSLIFIYDLLIYFHGVIGKTTGTDNIFVSVSQTINVSEVLHLLENYRDRIGTESKFQLENQFQMDLFKTFCSYIERKIEL